MKMKCHFCGKEFVNQKRFAAHCCGKMRRARALGTEAGLLAHYYYEKTLGPIEYERLPEERLFGFFLAAAEYVLRWNIVLPEGFIDFCRERKVAMGQFKDGALARRYVQWALLHEDAVRAAERSLANCPDIFSKPPFVQMSYIVSGKVSPILFEIHPARREEMLFGLTEDEKKELYTIYNRAAWAIRVSSLTADERQNILKMCH
jgi:hypothetical protein